MTGVARSRVREPERTLRLAAASPGELAALLARSDAELRSRQEPDGGAADCRLGIVAPDAKRMALARKVVTRGKPWRGRNDVWFSPQPLLAAPDAKVAFVFPGLEGEFAPQVRDVAGWLGVPVPVLRNDTIGSYAASLLAVGRLLDNALRRMAIRPDVAVGHSVGEWSAMICGEIFSSAEFDDMLVRTDLDSLQVPGVEFGVLGCGVEQAAEAIKGTPDLVISHENSTNQTVVCGHPTEVEALLHRFRERGVICQVLPFRSGFHTPMMRPYLAPFRAGVPSLGIHPAAIPVFSATTAKPFPADPRAARELCVRHLLEPVRFRGTVLALHATGARVFIQVGGGQLGSLIDDTLRDAEHLTIVANSMHRAGMDQLRRVATALWVEGGRPQFPESTGAEARVRQAPNAQPAPAPMPSTSDSSTSDSSTSDNEIPATVGALARLQKLGGRFPAAGELRALLEEVAESVAVVMEAATSQPRPAAQVTPVKRDVPLTAVLPAALDTTLHISTAAMPYLRDHCMVAQRAGWPREADRRPVVPATTMIKHMMDAAERSSPGRVAVGVDDVRLHRWLTAAPPQDVAVRVRPVDAGSVKVTLGDHAEAVVLLAEAYQPEAPGVWPVAPDERPTAITAEQLYQQRWLFHGSRLRVVSKAVGIAQRAVRGEITAPDVPGGLLDGVGQVLGQWLMERQPDRWIAFPARIARIRFHTAEPVPGTRMGCAVRIQDLADDMVDADAQVTFAGKVAVSITGWQDRRFDSDERAGALHRYPELNTLAEQQPEGWWLLAERSPSLASREFYLQKYLDGAEWEEYTRCPPRQRRHWLLRRTVVKDAVRGWLWDRGAGPLYPAEIAVTESAEGQCSVRGLHGLRFPALHVAVAHCREIAVARVWADEPGATANGIEVVELPDGGVPDRAERRVLAASLAARRERDIGLTEGLWSWPGPDHRVEIAVVGNPDRLPARKYVVAWTTGSAQKLQKESTQ